jgi:hypothetical protein
VTCATTRIRSLPEFECAPYTPRSLAAGSRRRLLAVIRAFGCRTAAYGYDVTRYDKFLIMTGTRPALDALELLLPPIAVQEEQAAATLKGYASLMFNGLPRLSSKA